jgi:peptide/nickel transport system substrate-binding protein
MRLHLTATLTAAALALLAAGCSGTTAPARTGGASASAAAVIPLLRIGDDAPLSTLDTGADEGNDVYGTLETLTRFGPGGQVEPDLASSVSHPDAVTYVYHLRRDVKFWNGDPMTSADVVNALDYYRKPGSYVSAEIAPVKSVTASGPYAVTVTLKNSYAPWSAETTSQFPIFEKKFADEHKTTMGRPGTLIMGTGPWEISSFDPTTGLELSANPHWWGGMAPVKRISVKFFSSETSMALAMRSGEIDLAFPSNGKTFEAAAGNGATLTTWSPPSIYFVAMNVKAAPFDDVHVRRAVAYALNRTDLIAANGGTLTATTQSTLIPPSQLQVLGSQAQVSALLGSLPQYPFNLEKAKQELAQSRYPHGFTARTEIDNYGNDVEVIQAIGAELQKIGISLQVSQVSAAQWSKDFSTGNLGGIAYTAFYAASPDPSIFPSYLLGDASTYNMSRYAPKSIDTLMESGLADSSPAQRLSDYGQLLRNVATDVPYVVLFAGHNYTELSAKYTLPPFTVYPAFSSWALNLKEKTS